MGTWNDGQYGVVASNTNDAYSVWVKWWGVASAAPLR